jgi:plasmid stabilization system protein ParE
MDYKVDFATQTERDLFSITQFLAEKNPAAARRLGDALIDAALSLGSLPRRGGLVMGRPGVLKLVHLPYHVIFYRIDETKRLVEILRFWDGRQDPADLTLP